MINNSRFCLVSDSDSFWKKTMALLSGRNFKSEIVPLADYFSTILIEKKITPLEGLKLFIPERERTLGFDSLAIKSLVAGFTRGKA